MLNAGAVECLIGGIGVDLVSIPRIEKILSRHRDRFLGRVLGAREKEELQIRNFPAASLAARFAAKEAVLKALGCGIGPAALHEVEIISCPGRQPEVRLLGSAALLAAEKGITGIAVSMTHEPPFACAVAAVRREGDAVL